jgi:hypothetical protein
MTMSAITQAGLSVPMVKLLTCGTLHSTKPLEEAEYILKRINSLPAGAIHTAEDRRLFRDLLAEAIRLIESGRLSAREGVTLRRLAAE